MRPTDPNTRVLPNGDKVLYSTFCLKVLLVPRRSSCGDFKLNFNKMVYWPQALPSNIRSQRKIQSTFSQVSLSITKTLFVFQNWKFNWNQEPFISYNTISKELCPHKKDIADLALWKATTIDLKWSISFHISWHSKT